MSVYGYLLAIVVVAAACDRRDERHTAPERSAPVAVETPQPLEPEVAGRRGRRADVGARRLAVVARLAELVEPSDGAIVGSRCPIDEERRPALGCTTWSDVGTWKTGPDGPPNPLVIPVPRGAGTRRPQLLQWSLGEPGRVFDTPRPATILAAEETVLRVDPGEVVGPTAPPYTRMTLRMRPTLPERVVTAPVTVPPDAMLELGLAIDTTMPHDDVEAVDFAVSVETEGGERPLFESRIATKDPAAGRWTDHRVALAALAGLQVRFVFTTRLVARDGADPSRVAALPLWGAPEILAPSDDPALDVILISFDTLRADHVGAYGSDLPTTPHLDQLATEGVVFDDVFAAYPSTTASHMTMLTGLYPVSHGMVVAGRLLPPKLPSLATVLGARGWRTGAVTEDGMLRADAGFSNGVSFYREIVKSEELGKESRVAASTFDAAIRWIAAHADERFFLFLHTYVVHWPYEPPAEFDVFETWRHDGIETPLADAPPIQQLRHRYAGEARFGDALFGRLQTELARLGLADRTLVVVTSDHGEEFGEHGGWSHSHTLYDEVLHVPLIFWAPHALGTPRRVAGPASLADLMPTVLDVLDVPAPPGVEGRSLLEPSPANRVVFAEKSSTDRVRQVMARTADAKWIWDFRDQRLVEAFDLRADPGERRPITDPAFHARGAPYLADYVARAQPPGAIVAEPAPEQPVSPDTAEKLRELGYVP
jgi:arylsulfatase A-like enzyme